MERKSSKPNEFPVQDDFGSPYIMLCKDRKPICRTICIKAPFQVSNCWSIYDMKVTSKCPLKGLPCFTLRPSFETDHQVMEWGKFTQFLRSSNKAAVVRLENCECYILPRLKDDKSPGDALVLYKVFGVADNKNDRFDKSLMVRKNSASPDDSMKAGACERPQTCIPAVNAFRSNKMRNTELEEIGESLEANNSGIEINHDMGKDTSDHSGNAPLAGSHSKPHTTSRNHDDRVKKNFARAVPSYLKTLGQTHSGWIFGAIAELVDNSRDAKATKLEIYVQKVYSKRDREIIPMLSFVDDGCGMSHQEIFVMLSLGHDRPDVDDRDHIGRFGIGFKTGAMKLGRDVIVLTQTTNSRSIAFLSQSFNEGKDNVEIPIVTYVRHGSIMELDRSIQSESSADYHLKAIKEFSPFDEFFIGEKLGLFSGNVTGTQIYIWNLDKWGSDFSLEWQKRNEGKNEDDILIRSRRIRARSGQISQKVPLDYSLRSYLEVIFLDPLMKIYIQGSMVKSRRLEKVLNKTKIVRAEIMGKAVQLTLGRCQQEWELMNCGIFLYWHGRLIEAYKRVGGMVHNADMGRGVIGVIDVTDLMSDGNVDFIHNNKQGFVDTEAYAKLEEWLGQQSDEYWDENFDTLQLKKGNAKYKPDHEWVQCDKCRKWRMLSSGFDSNTLPKEWCCMMEPFNGKCESAEEVMEPGVITVSTKRRRCDPNEKPAVVEICTKGGRCDDSGKALENDKSKAVIGKSGARGVGGTSDESSHTFERSGLKDWKRLRRSHNGSTRSSRRSQR